MKLKKTTFTNYEIKSIDFENNLIKFSLILKTVHKFEKGSSDFEKKLQEIEKRSRI